MANRCCLTKPLQQWMIAFALTTYFEAPTQQMLEMASAMGQSWLQGRINEEGNKILRDQQHPNNASQVGAQPFPWEGCCQLASGLLRSRLQLDACSISVCMRVGPHPVYSAAFERIDDKR